MKSLPKPLRHGPNSRELPKAKTATAACGKVVHLLGEEFYQIANFDRLTPFFMSIVNPGDHWMFISSNGGLTAGRRNPDLALFPYYTDDKIRDMAEVTGPKTILRIRKSREEQVWEPLCDRGSGRFATQRNLYKNFRGNKLIFEEINHELELSFRYGWFNSRRFGFVRRAWLSNFGKATVRISLLDGLQNIMPCGTTSQFNLEYSTLLDAYKRSELIPETGLALFRLSSIPVDRPEPAEALRTNIVWSAGLNPQRRLLSSTQLDAFRRRLPLKTETDVRGVRGAYFIESEVLLRPGQTTEWIFVADVNQGPSEVAKINYWVRTGTRTSGQGCPRSELVAEVEADIQAGTLELDRIVARADGLQKSAAPLANARHYNNTLFNIMRGGVFNDGYHIYPGDLRAFIASANKAVASRNEKFFRILRKNYSTASQPASNSSNSFNGCSSCNYSSVVTVAAQTGDSQLERLCREYLPLSFSRRHGDPSRPWNRFSISPQKPDGSRILDYQGNWRDIFQNWEALAVSFPGFLSGMICRFVNASTPDGYNPYRITRYGIDWEVLDPHDPWSYIGYWGDHQIIYLLKLLESLERHEPDTLQQFLARDIFAFANVPYRIKPYHELLTNPKSTVLFDEELHNSIQKRVTEFGCDARLLSDKGGRVKLVNLTEKLLIPILAKLSNFIPGAGIWLNTQRPEWNDANNALVGNGASMVTLYYLRRHLSFCRASFKHGTFQVSIEVQELFFAIERSLRRHRSLLKRELSDSNRRRVLNDLGKAGSAYREKIYGRGFAGKRSALSANQLKTFFDLALEWIDNSIRSNRRSDGLYHAYNLVKFENGKIPIRRLYPMLEGQVAVLSSRALTPKESLSVLDALRKSEMHRPDQHSYLLYPDRYLPQFVERNNIPKKELERSRFLRKLLTINNKRLVERDVEGRVHFNPDIRNSADVFRILDELSSTAGLSLTKKERAETVDLFERQFDHESFTGRSGTFFGYEGLGCIYWHMVSKLLLAAQECYLDAVEQAAPAAVRKGLAERYHDIRSGLGDCKSPEVYGAFPADPYSHTPAHAGARQPGLTGQVKEDILCRFGELGVTVRDGAIHFKPLLLQQSEFLHGGGRFDYIDVFGRSQSLRLPPRSLAFTFCQTPIVYELTEDTGMTVEFANSSSKQFAKAELDKSASASILNRTGEIEKVIVQLNRLQSVS